MKLGYACINESLGKNGRFKTITVKSAKTLPFKDLQAKIKKLILINLNTVYRILKWNVANDILMYRISSNLIPLDGHELNQFDWENDKDILKVCAAIKEYVVDNDIRISMHPDQFCVLSSHNPEVVVNSIKILEYHNKLSNLLGNKTLILHVGSTNGGKLESINRFINSFNLLDKDIQNKIVVENDDKSYNVEDVLNLCKTLKIPMCLDIHHDNCNLSNNNLSHYIDDIALTWYHSRSEIPKCHLSSGRGQKTDRSHADYISYKDYEYCLKITKGKFDIMFECKKKDLSVLDMYDKYGNPDK